MNAMEVLLTRRSVKKYKPDMVPEDVIERICKAGVNAPTGQNLQSPIILAVTNKDLRDRLSAMNAKILGKDIDPFYGAPVVLVVLADRTVRTHIYDGSLVMGNLMLAARAEGFGSCWIHRAREEFDSEEGRQILKELGIEGDYEGIGHCVLGYPDCEVPAAKAHKSDYVHWVK